MYSLLAEHFPHLLPSFRNGPDERVAAHTLTHQQKKKRKQHRKEQNARTHAGPIMPMRFISQRIRTARTRDGGNPF